MLNAIIRFSLQQRVLVLSVAALLMAMGAWKATQLPIDVFPNLNRPRVTVMTEAPGMAPEEVETLITFPLETALNGATGVEVVRSQSGSGLSVIYVDFAWGTEIYTDRQVVAERLAVAQESLPEGISPQLAPVSSIMGQIMVVGMWSRDGSTDPLELRTLADWVVRRRLLTVPGVSQVFVMGGDRMQFQVLVDPDKLRRWGVTLHQVEESVARSNANVTGGYLDQQGPNEYLVRGLGRVSSVKEIRDIVIAVREGRPVLLHQVAEVSEAPQVKRGNSSAFVREGPDNFDGGPAVVLTITKQPEADTRRVTDDITEALKQLGASLPDDVRIEPSLYQQKGFIDRAIENVAEALRDGGLLVVVILIIFLLDVRATFITLLAIPLSITMTALIFAAFGLGINTMTLGGLAVAIGELVDDAIVDVENIHRRLHENALRLNPLPKLLVVFRASSEIRNSIVFGTMIVVLVFLPLFALSGMEGRLFPPMGVAYVVSLISSLLVSLTVTPALASLLLSGGRPKPATEAKATETNATEKPKRKDNLLVWSLKAVAGGIIRLSTYLGWPILAVTALVVAVAGVGLWNLENDFLPPFDEGVAQINVLLPPGASLAKSEEVARQVEDRLKEIPDLEAFVRRTGRAELDEHAMPVNLSEIIASFDPASERSREEILEDVRERLEEVPGIITATEQPLAHLISHMLSGVTAQIAIKLYGDNLDTLRREAGKIEAAIKEIEGITDLQVEQQANIPQLRVEIDGHALAQYGLQRADVYELLETALGGKIVSEVLQGERTFDLLVRLEDRFREDRQALERLAVPLPQGGAIPLADVAKIYEAGGPNVIQRENARRRIVIQANVSDRGLVDVVNDIRERLDPIERDLPTGYFVDLGGQFESQASASQTLAITFGLALFGMFLVLYSMFGSANLALQVMGVLPVAFVGSVAALYLTNQTMTVAAMVGFISLCGIASRNGILLINHYLHLVKYEGETFNREMIVRAGLERLSPVLMTALTSGIGLVPLALAAGEPGKEILYPVATVIIGGLITSTLAEFFLRPALFWLFGRAAAERSLTDATPPLELEEA
jgi:HME family heavy-metal exporter